MALNGGEPVSTKENPIFFRIKDNSKKEVKAPSSPEPLSQYPSSWFSDEGTDKKTVAKIKTSAKEALKNLRGMVRHGFEHNNISVYF